MKWLLLLWLPVAAMAQETFGPLRLNDSLGINFYYPTVSRATDNSILCTWAQVDDRALSAYGQIISASGQPLGSRITYEQQLAGHITCPASIQFAHFADGGEARLLHHS
jgi:hypothetical protein